MNKLNRKDIYKLPFSQVDNQGAWIEITDQCNFSCYGCYRHQLHGQKPLSEIKEEIEQCITGTNCDVIVIAGGEPMLHPQIYEIVNYIKSKGRRSLMLSNGSLIDKPSLAELEKSGLTKIHFHVDQHQKRKGWESANEEELNSLRQYYADFLFDNSKILCGFNITLSPENEKYVPSIIDWSLKNIKKVQHVSLITLRGIPYEPNYSYQVGSRLLNANEVPNLFTDLSSISLQGEKVFSDIRNNFPLIEPSAYINGKNNLAVYKYIISTIIGTKKDIYGSIGSKTTELTQIWYHFFKGHYMSFLPKRTVGPGIFLLSVFDGKIRKAFTRFLTSVVKNPLKLFYKIYMQTIAVQQPMEFINGKKVQCDNCINPMSYKGQLINPCQLDEYRLLGGEVELRKTN